MFLCMRKEAIVYNPLYVHPLNRVNLSFLVRYVDIFYQQIYFFVSKKLFNFKLNGNNSVR